MCWELGRSGFKKPRVSSRRQRCWCGAEVAGECDTMPVGSVAIYSQRSTHSNDPCTRTGRKAHAVPAWAGPFPLRHDYPVKSMVLHSPGVPCCKSGARPLALPRPAVPVSRHVRKIDTTHLHTLAQDCVMWWGTCVRRKEVSAAAASRLDAFPSCGAQDGLMLG